MPVARYGEEGHYTSPEQVEHAEEAHLIERKLHELGLNPKMVRPTTDFTGHVRLDFRACAKIFRLVDPDWETTTLTPLPEAYEDLLGAEETDV